ncbi:hypothetical protein ACEWY4_027541 [Coilia grayii]|uniref:B30.2/SPRY domain-containing protein n=1 Tax=Coilia grayii TaxID=363190 RepID=A0ABD1IRK7_9TELE
MSTTVNPTGTPQLTTDELTVIVASMSCLVFFLIVVMLLFLLHRREPLCCKVRQYQESHTDLDMSPQYYSSTQTLVGPPCSQQNFSHGNTRGQSDSLFLIGLPSSYGLPSLAVPRLPSYESVRKKDRQRQIHMMIADRFGLNGPYIAEPPPSYEESVRHSVEIPCPVIGPLHAPGDPIGSPDIPCPVIGPLHAPDDAIGSPDIPCPVIGSLHAPGDAIGSSEIPCPVIGPLHAPRDAIGSLEIPSPVIGPLHQPGDAIGSSQTPCDRIGPLHSSSEAIGPSEVSSNAIGPLHSPNDVIGPSEDSCIAIGPLEASHDVTDPSEVPYYVNELSRPPCDTIGPFEAGLHFIGTLDPCCNGIGPLNTSSHVPLENPAKMMQCLQFLVEPAKNITVKLKESRKRAKNEKRDPLDESQLFIVQLAKDLRRVCQRAEVLDHISSCEDVWPSLTCRAATLEWAALLESKKHPEQVWSECVVWGDLAVSSEVDMESARRVIISWLKEIRAIPEQTVWPGEAVVTMLDDLEAQWRRGKEATLQTAMELVFYTLLHCGLEKDTIPQQWLMWKQRSQKIGAIPYIPHTVWDWICEAGVEVTLDLDTANPDLLISADERRMRCGFERKDVPNSHLRFDGWWCAVGMEGYTRGRHYWEVDVGEMDWRLGVARESALRKGFKSLNTQTGYLTLRLERGTEFKALTVPFTALPGRLIPRRVGVLLDHHAGQLSFYDAHARAHIYTYNGFDGQEKLYPLFGTTEIIKDLVIRPPAHPSTCLCPAMCVWG